MTQSIIRLWMIESVMEAARFLAPQGAFHDQAGDCDQIP